MKRFVLIPIALICLVTLALSGLQLWACAVPVREGHRVETLEERALIIWDAKTKTQHFIREAKFRSSAPNFGFLVPTPTQPALSEADVRVFQVLEGTTAPERIPRVVRKPRPKPKPSDRKIRSEPPATSAPVEVLHRQMIAGYDASVLKATDVDALADWLTTNEYEFRPELREWLKRYTDDGWIITAFRLAGNDAGRMQTKAIQMSFNAEQPFYPYREPEHMRDPKQTHDERMLRLFMLSDTAVDARLGKELGPWHAKVAWRDKVDSAKADNILDSLRPREGRVENEGNRDVKYAEDLARDGWWLTEYEDNSSPRPGTEELYFTAAENARTVKRPPVYYDQIEYYDPGENTSVASNTVVVSETVSPVFVPWFVIAAAVGGAVLVAVVVISVMGSRKSDG